MSWKNLRNFIHTRSISFRLYLIIIPTTILAISLLGYLDGRFAVGMLDRQDGGGYSQVCDMAGREFDNRPEILKWLGEMCGIEGKQACNAA